MGRAYAGILGSLACGITVARGLLAGADVPGILLAASGALFLFAALGYLAGQIGELIVRDSVQTQFQSAMADWEKQHPTQTKPTT
jgi:hypothetical protein